MADSNRTLAIDHLRRFSISTPPAENKENGYEIAFSNKEDRHAELVSTSSPTSENRQRKQSIRNKIQFSIGERIIESATENGENEEEAGNENLGYENESRENSSADENQVTTGEHHVAVDVAEEATEKKDVVAVRRKSHTTQTHGTPRQIVTAEVDEVSGEHRRMPYHHHNHHERERRSSHYERRTSVHERRPSHRERRLSHHHERRKISRHHLHSSVDEIHDASSAPNVEEDISDQNDASGRAEQPSDSHLTHIFPIEESIVVIDENTLPNTDVVHDSKNIGDGITRPRQQKSNTVILENLNRAKAINFVLQMQLRFTSLGMVVHGLTAGLALAQCIFVFSFSNVSDSKLMDNYCSLSILFDALYYFLLAISTVSVLDRYIDLDTNFNETLKHIVCKPLRAVTLISYILALIFSVSLARLDDKISRYKTVPSVKATHPELDTWMILNLIRVIGSIGGWLSIALAPNDDTTTYSVTGILAKRKEGKAKEEEEIDAISSTTSKTKLTSSI